MSLSYNCISYKFLFKFLATKMFTRWKVFCCGGYYSLNPFCCPTFLLENFSAPVKCSISWENFVEMLHLIHFDTQTEPGCHFHKKMSFYLVAEIPVILFYITLSVYITCKTPYKLTGQHMIQAGPLQIIQKVKSLSIIYCGPQKQLAYDLYITLLSPQGTF